MKCVDYPWRHRMAALFTSSGRRSNDSYAKERHKCQNPMKQPLDSPCQCPTCCTVYPDSRTRVFNIHELLSIIFEHCIPEDDMPTNSPLSPPCMLTRVCRLWRQVALATPRLWARIYLVCFPSVPCRMLALRHFDVLTEWFGRSGGCPTSLRLRYLGSSASDVRNISMILTAAVAHAHRWREVDITAPMPCLKPILQLLGHGTPELETCRITITSANAPSEQEDLVIDLDNLIAFRLGAVTLDLWYARKLKQLNLKTDALTDIIFAGLPPSLHTLSLHNCDVLLGPPGLALSIRGMNLRRLYLHSHIHISLLGQLAEAFPHLEDAYLDIKHGTDPESESTYGLASITFPTMQALALRAVSLSGTADLHALGICLDVLRLPTLARLSLSVGCARLGRWTALSRHLARTRPPLTELTFMGAYFTEEEFLAVLREAPELENLKMFVRLSDSALAALTLPAPGLCIQREYQPPERGLCPRLKYLDVPLASSCSSESVVAMLKSRRSSQLPVEDNYNEEQQSKEQIQSCKARLEECRLILSEPGTIERIEHHPDVAHCIERGLVLDLRRF